MQKAFSYRICLELKNFKFVCHGLIVRTSAFHRLKIDDQPDDKPFSVQQLLIVHTLATYVMRGHHPSYSD